MGINRFQSSGICSGQLHFGWSKTNPPINNGYLNLSPSDIKNLSSRPTDRFVRESVQQMLRPGILDAVGALDRKRPGFFVIDGEALDQFAGDPQGLKRFYKSLSRGVMGALRVERLKRDESINKLYIGHMTKKDVIQSMRGGRPTTKLPHFDPTPLYVSHLYYPTQNVQGGNLRLYDIAQYLHDHPGVSKEDISTRIKGEHNRIITLSEAELEPYKIEFERHNDKPMIIFFDNESIAHGVQEPTIVDDTQPVNRTYLRYCLTEIPLSRIRDRELWFDLLSIIHGRTARREADSIHTEASTK